MNTACILRTGLLAGQDDMAVDEQIAINLRSSINVACEAFAVRKERSGSIARFASSSYTRGGAHAAVYSATKAAVVNLIQGLTEEYLPFGVRINAINPERIADAQVHRELWPGAGRQFAGCEHGRASHTAGSVVERNR